jgi:cytochrome c biogenesis factor
MLAEVGLAAMGLAFLAALYTIFVAIYGARTRSERLVLSARNAALATFQLLIVAAGALVVALLRQEYQISYVWSVTDPNTPSFFRFTAVGIAASSIPFCSLLSAFAAGTMIHCSDRRLMPHAMAFA